MRDQSESFCAPRPLSNAQLTADVQTVTGIISLLKYYYQLSNNHQPRNTWLYGSGSSGLNDMITSGSNPGLQHAWFLSHCWMGSCASSCTKFVKALADSILAPR